jgi:hypothetical protein
VVGEGASDSLLLLLKLMLMLMMMKPMMMMISRWILMRVPLDMAMDLGIAALLQRERPSSMAARQAPQRRFLRRHDHLRRCRSPRQPRHRLMIMTMVMMTMMMMMICVAGDPPAMGPRSHHRRIPAAAAAAAAVVVPLA